MNAGAGRGGEQPVAEDRQVEHRCAAAVLDRDEGREQDRGGHQPADHDRVVPADDAALRHREDEPGEPDDERDDAAEVEPAVVVGGDELVQHERAPRRGGQAERHVEPEHPVPGDRDQHAAEHRTEHEPDRGDHRVRPHGEAQLLLRERVGDQRGGVREQERGAEALDDAPDDQLRAVLREPGAERGQREGEEAADVGALAAEEVGQPAGGEDEHGRGDHVGEDHPDEPEQARVSARSRSGGR